MRPTLTMIALGVPTGVQVGALALARLAGYRFVRPRTR